VDGVDEDKRLVRFAGRSRRPLRDGPEPARYYVENAFELLHTPGEWYLNRRTGVLYYWPLPGESLREAEVVAPCCPTSSASRAGRRRTGPWNMSSSAA
jgi:hypothetical protein